MGSQATAHQQDGTDPRPRLPRMRRPATPLVPDALGRAVDRNNRLDALTRELQAAGGQGRTSAWLAERLGVSTRTVKRDVTALQRAGVPIRSTSGPQGGYVIGDVAAPAPPAFTPEEALAVVVGLQAVPDQPFAAAGRNAVAKVLRAVPPEQRAEVARAANRIWIRPGEPDASTDDSVRQVLAEAVRDHRVVLLDYQPADNPGSPTRQVEPLGFAHSHGHWFALAWCREHDAGRWFQFEHITAVQPTHERFEPRDVREIFRPPAE